jgi:hypothetical protein
MAFTKSYLIPVGDLTLEDRRSLRADVDEKLRASALSLAIQPDDSSLLIRDTLPNTDFGVGIGGPGVGAGTAEDWLDQIAGVAGTEHQYFVAVLANDRCVGFWGVAAESAPPSISRIRLTLGAASAQTRGVFQLEPLYSRLEAAGLFSEAVIFKKQETVRVMVMPRLAYAILTERLVLLARTIEPIGAVVSASSI